VFRVAAGRFLAAPLWQRVDDELQAQQALATRLGAENASLRASARDPDGVGWRLLGVLVLMTLGAGVAMGAAL
jgi:hypothetical protein